MFNHLNRYLYLACVSLCVSIFIVAHPFAQTTAEKFDDAQKIAQWGQSLQGLETRAINTMDHPNFDFLLNSIISDELADMDKLTQKYEEWVDFNNTEFAAIREEFENLPDIPITSSIDEALNAMRAQKNGLADIINELEAALDKTETLFHAAIFEANPDLIELAVIQLESVKRLIESENKMLLQSLVAVGDDHPQMNLSEQGILTNDFLLAYMDIQINYQRDENALSDRKPDIAKMRKTLKSYKKSIKAGRKKQSNFNRRLLLAKNLGGTPEQTAQITFSRQIIDSYTPSFLAEDAILENFKDLMALLETDTGFEDIEADVDVYIDRLSTLIDERLKYHTARQTLIANGQ